MLHPVHRFGMYLTAVLLLPHWAFAQSGPGVTPPIRTEAAPTMTWRARATGEWMDGAKLDGPGELDVARAGADVWATKTWNTNLRTTFGLGVEGIDFSFHGPTKFHPVVRDLPWETVGTIDASALLEYDWSADTTLFAGALAGLAAEGNADWSHAFNWGLSFGAAYRVNPDLMVGINLTLFQGMEDSIFVVPMPIFNWAFAENWSARLTGPNSIDTFGGLQLVYRPGGSWEFLAGVAYRYERFRVADSTIGPDGIGEMSDTPIYIGANWTITDKMQFSAALALVTFGEVVLSDDDGDTITEADFSPALAIRAALRVSF